MSFEQNCFQESKLSDTIILKSSNICFTREIFLIKDSANVSSKLGFIESLKCKIEITVSVLENCSETIDNALTKICIKSSSLNDCLNVENLFFFNIPTDWFTFKKPSFPNFRYINELTSAETHLKGILDKSFEIISECLKNQSENEVFLSFNGGKDCTLLLHLLCCYYTKNGLTSPLKILYIKEENCFQEITNFIAFIKKYYNVEICILPTPMRTSLEKYIETNPNLKITFLGVRKGDPMSNNLQHIQETDVGWPKLTRVFPILHWSYSNVWDFIRCTNIPYCTLYNYGYTSLGSQSNTIKNPDLKYTTSENCDIYKPAFLLNDQAEERCGRIKS